MRPQRVVFTYFLIHAVVANLYYYDLLGENSQGSKSEKLGHELHIFFNFMQVMMYNINEFVFTLCVMAPTFIVAISF
jgi:hypothetical protein